MIGTWEGTELEATGCLSMVVNQSLNAYGTMSGQSADANLPASYTHRAQWSLPAESAYTDDSLQRNHTTDGTNPMAISNITNVESNNRS